MKILHHRQFDKHFHQRIAFSSKLVKQFCDRVTLFAANPQCPLLRDHALVGKKSGYRAFSITADIRIIYIQIDSNTVQFYDIGTHNQVY